MHNRLSLNVYVNVKIALQTAVSEVKHYIYINVRFKLKITDSWYAHQSIAGCAQYLP